MVRWPLYHCVCLSQEGCTTQRGQMKVVSVHLLSFALAVESLCSLKGESLLLPWRLVVWPTTEETGQSQGRIET
uniref:Uncharacterized protein n=1 Tax=Anguilla anguilla TaxID=7936 RepID=A0A0E9QW86_ANGAN